MRGLLVELAPRWSSWRRRRSRTAKTHPQMHQRKAVGGSASRLPARPPARLDRRQGQHAVRQRRTATSSTSSPTSSPSTSRTSTPDRSPSTPAINVSPRSRHRCGIDGDLNGHRITVSRLSRLAGQPRAADSADHRAEADESDGVGEVRRCCRAAAPISRLAWIPRTFMPYVGAGGGYGTYEFRQNGDFVDFDNGNRVLQRHLHVARLVADVPRARRHRHPGVSTL